MSTRDLGGGRVARQKNEAENRRVLPLQGVEQKHLNIGIVNQLVPAGTILDFGGVTAPAGYLVCDGSELDIAQFPDLHAAIGTVWGTSDAGVTKFNLPDMRGRVARGHDNGIGRDPEAALRGGGPIQSHDISITGQATGDNVGSPQGPSTQRPTILQFTSNNESAVHQHTNPSTGNQSSSHQHAITEGGNAIRGVDCLDGTRGSFGDISRGQNTLTAIANFSIGSQNQNHTHAQGNTGSENANHTHNIATGGDAETRMRNVYTNKIIKI